MGDERSLLAFLRRPDYRPMPQRQLLHGMNVSRDGRPAMRRLIVRMLDEGKLVKIGGGRLIAAPERGRIGGGGRDLLGVFVERARHGEVLPFDPAWRDAIRIPAADRGGATDRQVVRVELPRAPADGAPATGRVVGLLGRLDDPGVDVEVVAAKFELVREMPAEVLEEARALPARIAPAELARRRRFDDPAPVTIDGETAQDFDDAIAVRALPRGRFRLFVHIADVARFVAPGSALDREAARRGTSVYFPGEVFPMLPERLSNDLCSLRPGVDRLVQSVILDVAADGSIERARFADGVIRSAARLTYTQVGELLAGAERVAGIPPRVVPMLGVAGRLRAALEARRSARGSIDFDLPEPRILLDVEGAMTGVTIEPRNEAHRLIEECMLAANESVAAHLERRGDPCMYRNHEPPDPDKLEVLREFVASLGVRTRGGGVDGLEAIGRLLDAFEGRPEARVVGLMALRSMKQARYAMENAGHFGLAAPTYCHFTSPIRRYPDLVVHRLLRASRAGRVVTGEPGVLDEVARLSSELERNAEAAERELLEWKKLAFVRDQVGERFAGVVTAVVPFGLFVQLNDNLVEGLLRVDRLGDERFLHDPSRQEMRGVRSGRRFRLGDRLTVRIDRVDRVLRRVDFSLDELSLPRRRERPKEAGGRPRRRSARRPGRRERAARRSRPHRS